MDRGKKLSYLFKISKLISQYITVNLHIFNYEMVKNMYIYIDIYSSLLFIFNYFKSLKCLIHAVS